uniref:Uncharacterized protein n=1 Tax=Anopheles atroparvus TaxID=41427 RepID=A0AAG5DEH5_ANOAO
MVTIRNDIESNGMANRSPDGTGTALTGVDGVKNVNHLANGSRRSTMVDLKSKTFNRKCVGFLALIVCVGVCFGVGMLFLYGHLVDRLNESAIAGTMWHDKNGNPVKPVPSPGNDTPATTVDSISTFTSTEAHSTPRTVSSTTPSARTSTIASTSTMYPVVYSTTDKPDDGFDLDSKQIPRKDGDETTSPKIDLQIGDRNRDQYDDEDDDVGSGDVSGNGSDNEYENDQPYDGSGRRN